MKFNKKYLFIGILFLALGLIAFVFFAKTSHKNLSLNDVTTTVETKITTVEKEEYKSPINFKKLKKQNEDIVAWLDIPGTDISYPVYCHTEDDSYYIDHDRNGDYSRSGEIFIENEYNSKDFSDIVTLIYGHNMKAETMFGALQKSYSSEEKIKEHHEIIVYTEKAEFHYEVFAATTFDNRHILYNYNFNNKNVYASFFEKIKNTRSLDTYFDEETFNKCSNIIVLSTCKNGNLSDRYLLFAGIIDKNKTNTTEE